ncbi:MAG: TonB-dependent receptor [Hymenobacteraceae bacterium]|nr:TonB-dependent receptor [Hymenobacteraceae bacterium]
MYPQKLLLLFAFIFSAFTLYAQNQLGSIYGTVTDEHGNPVEQLTVALEGSVLGTNTNANGEYTLTGIQPGSYMLRIGGIGFKSIRQQVDLQPQSNLKLSYTIATSTNSLSEVVVSASRSAETLDETPSSVHIVDKATLETQVKVNSNISSVLAATVPGLAMNTNTTSNTGQTLRGRNVLVMVDGIPQSTPLRAGGRDIRTIDPAAIERVEVVKGATAIYGNGADGGLINYITKKPDASKPFSATTTLANTGMLFHADNTFGGRITQQFSGKINKLDYVTSGTYEQTGVYKDAEGEVISPVYGLGETQIYNGFAKLGYNVTSNNRVEVMYNYFGSRQASQYLEKEGKYGETPTIGVLGERQGKEEGTRYNHNLQAKYTANNVIGKTGLEASAYMQHFYTIYGFSSYFQNGGQSTIESKKKGVRLSFNTPFAINDDVQGNVTYGADYANDITSQPLVDGRTWVPEINMKNGAPYAQLQMNILEDFVFKAGYRYDFVNITVPDFNQLVDAQGRGGNFVTGGDIDFNAQTFNTGLRYTGLPFFKPFVSFSKGYTIIDLGRYVRAAKEDDISNMNIEPVIVNNYEAGFHSSIGKFAFSGAYFISTSELGANLVETDGVYSIQRAPEKVKGFEVVADYFATKWLQLGASAAYSEGKVDLDNNNKFNDKEDAFLNGTRIAPAKITAYANVKPTSKWNINLQWLYSGNRNHFADKKAANGTYAFGEGPVKAFDVVNLASTYAVSEKVSLNLGIENLLNETYYLPASMWYGRASNYVRANGARFQFGATINW